MKNLTKALNEFGSEAVRYMKLNLGVTRRRISRRSKWKKNGKKWRATSTKIKYRKGRSVATGKLQSSVKHKVVGTKVQISMESYGDNVEYGRAPNSKMAPPSSIYKWTQAKKIQLRDLKTGKFEKEDHKKRKAMAFQMNRSIAYFGIEPYPFRSMAITRALDEHRGKIAEAMIKDIQDGIND